MNNILVLNHPLVLKPLKWSFFLRIFWILSIISIITLLVFYIYQVNAGVSESYLIQKYEKNIAEVSKENQNLGISAVQINSLNNITALLEPLNFERIDKIHYIRVLDTKVVVK